jgi:hypothetical protein
MNPVTICNMALGFFGGARVVSIEDSAANDSDEAALCNTFFEPSLRAVLEERAWLCATGFIDLGGGVDSPYAGASAEHALVKQFVLPATVIRPLACDDGSGEFTIQWERNGQKILSEDTTSLLCKAVLMVNDLNLCTPNLVLAVAYKLASVIAGPITQSSAIEQKMLAKYEEQVSKAGTLDGMQGATTQIAKIKSTSLALRR